MKKNGISLIVLVITIIIIIILAGAIILSLSDNNPITSANRATCVSDMSELKSAIALDIATQLSTSSNTGVMTTYAPGASVQALNSKLTKKYEKSFTITINPTTTGGKTMGELTLALTTPTSNLDSMGLKISADGTTIETK
ncbi:MAG: hypothetical protein RSE41_01715 [Clostridia bacterium]